MTKKIDSTMPLLMFTAAAALNACAPINKLCRAARSGDIQEVEALLPIVGVNPTEAPTPLQCAVASGQVEVVKLLIARGAQVNYPKESLPVQWAAGNRNADIAKLLLSEGADPESAVKNLENDAAWFESQNKAGFQNAAARDRATADWLRALASEEAPRIAAAKAAKAKAASENTARKTLEKHLSAIEAAEKAGDQAARSGDAEEALARYAEALRETPRGTEKDQALREKLLRFVSSLDARPAVPQEAVRRLNRSQAFVKKSQDAEGYNSAAAELEQALLIAPWWATAYFNLGLVQEKAENFTGAIQNFKLYLAAAPGSSDAPAVSKKIDELEVSKELAEKKATH